MFGREQGRSFNPLDLARFIKEKWSGKPKDAGQIIDSMGDEIVSKHHLLAELNTKLIKDSKKLLKLAGAGFQEYKNYAAEHGIPFEGTFSLPMEKTERSRTGQNICLEGNRYTITVCTEDLVEGVDAAFVVIKVVADINSNKLYVAQSARGRIKNGVNNEVSRVRVEMNDLQEITSYVVRRPGVNLNFPDASQ